METNEISNFIEPNYKKDAIVNTIANIAYLFALWLMTLLTPRIGNFNDAGIFTLALSVANICTAVATYNINIFYSSDIEHKYSDAHYLSFGVTTTFISLVLSVILCFAFGYTAETFWCVVLYYLFKCAENISLVLYVTMQRAGKLYVAGYSLLGKTVVCLLIFVLTLVLSKNLVLTFGILAAVAFAYMIFVDFTLTRHFSKNALSVNKTIYKMAMTLFLAALPVFIYGLSFATIPSFPRIVFGQFFSETEVGYFGTMSSICVLIQAAINALITPFIPKFAYCYEKKDSKGFAKLLGAFVLFDVVLTGIAFILVFFLGDWALQILYGEGTEILSYSYCFKWIVLATGLQALVIILADVLISTRKLISLLIISLLGLATMFATSYPIIQAWYMNGIVAVYCFSYGIMVIGFIYVLYKIYKDFHKPSLEENRG